MRLHFELKDNINLMNKLDSIAIFIYENKKSSKSLSCDSFSKYKTWLVSPPSFQGSGFQIMMDKVG